MSLVLKEDRIEINIPNSEASICAQREGIKDRTVGSYYMSEIHADVINFFNHFNANFYIDFASTFYDMRTLYEEIEKTGKTYLYKSCLAEQYAIMDEIEDLLRSNRDTVVKVPSPTINDNQKYLKFDRNDYYIKMFEDLLLGDLTRIIIRRLSNDCFVISGSFLEEFRTKIDNFR